VPDSVGVRGTDYPKLLHFVNQGGALHSESLRGTASTTHNPITCLKRTEDVISLNFFQPSHAHICALVLVEGFQFGSWRT
jgi:hypothetical protein